jgi:uncharacterized membrane protein
MKKEKLLPVLAVCLFISLGANIFIGSHMIGHFAQGRWSEMAADHRLRKSLTEQDRQILKKTVAENQEKMAVMLSGIAGAKEQAEIAVKADPFDAKALDAALTAEKSQKMKALLFVHEIREAVMKQMSPEGRAILLKMKRIGLDPRGGQWEHCSQGKKTSD